MTNLVYLVTVVVTNWVQMPSDYKTEDGTNYVREVQVVQTNTYYEEVKMCTNRINFKIDGELASTNSVKRWRPLPQAMNPPPLPLPR